MTTIHCTESNAIAAPRIFGLTAEDVHGALWANRKVQVVRPGTPFTPAPWAKAWLLLDADIFIDAHVTRRMRRAIRSRSVFCALPPNMTSRMLRAWTVSRIEFWTRRSLVVTMRS